MPGGLGLRPSDMKPSSPARVLLAVLLCQVLVVTQAFAIAGGPSVGTPGFSGGGAALDLTGTYSGVLQGLTETVPGSGDGSGSNNDDTDASAASSAIGLFELRIPAATAFASGTFLLFADGRVFTGVISAVPDPGSGLIRGILEANFTFNLPPVGAAPPVVVTAQALGRLDATVSGASAATVVTPSTTGGATGSTAATSTALLPLTGTANLDLNFGQVDTGTLQPIVARTLTFSVNGSRISPTVAAPAPIAVAAGAG